MKPVLVYAMLVLGAVACTSDDSPTQPGMPGEPSAAAAATAANSWSSRAAYPGPGIDGGSVAMAPNAAGQSIVYYLGGTEGEFDVGKPVKAYNVATNSWAIKSAKVDVWDANGAGKIGRRIYFSGGLTVIDDFDLQYTNQTWAYDYTGDRLIRRADMPIRSAQGVSGVIGDKLYVLPGICSTDNFPEPGYCSRRPTRRFFRYDPAANQWVARPWAPHFHAQGAAGVIQGKLYVVGGEGVADLDVYDPATNSWRTLAPIPTAGPAIGAVLLGKLVVITGRFGGELRTYEYTPRTNTWKALASPAMEHDGVARVSLGGNSHLLAVGGGHGFELDTPNPSELYTR
jgi:N-acetylneuraminic acid mutarotase